jgi:selenocysteine lyase/cysteine desulfurase
MGSYPEGTVRVSPGIYNTPGDVEALIDGVKQMQEIRGA